MFFIFSQGSAKPQGSTSGCTGLCQNRPKLPGIKFIATVLSRVARFIFSKKAKPSVKKGQKQPTKLLKKAKHSVKKAKTEPNLSLDKAKFIKIFFLTTQIHIKIHLVCSLCLHKKQLIHNYFVTYDRKMPSCFLFRKRLNQSTLNINSHFSIITQIVNISKAELAVY